MARAESGGFVTAMLDALCLCFAGYGLFFE